MKRKVKNDEKFHRNSCKLFLRISLELFIAICSTFSVQIHMSVMWRRIISESSEVSPQKMYLFVSFPQLFAVCMSMMDKIGQNYIEIAYTLFVL